MVWTIESKLSDNLSVSREISRNLIRLLDVEENTPTFVARYRTGETGNMSPEAVFCASKCIQELKDVKKKSGSLLAHLEKEQKLTKPLKKEIEAIDDLDELNETVKMYKTAKSSAIQKAIDNGIEDAFHQGTELLIN